MTRTLRNLLAVPDLRRRILFTLALLAVYRLGCNLPVPGIDLGVLFELTAQLRGSFFGYLNLFTGGSLERAAVFALGIVPYITASIVLQLLTVTVPHLEKLSKEGELGRRRITQYTRYATLLLAAVESLSIALSIEGLTTPGGPLVPNPGWGFRLTTLVTLTAGCAVVMWLGEQITERGLGNGISLIIFAGIVVGFPGAVRSMVDRTREGSLSPLALAILLLVFVLVTAAVVFVERSQRRIPVRYAKRVVARGVYGGQSTYLPLKVNTAGVIPVIFASSVVVVPGAIASLAPLDLSWLHASAAALGNGQPVFYLLYAAAIVFFSFLYVSILFSPQDTADAMRRNGGFIPGVRSGGPTARYVDRVLTRLTLIGGIYLAAVSILPELLIFGFRVGGLPWVGAALEDLLPPWVTTGLGIDFYFGGTSLLIVVGVTMDFVQQVESHLVMHHYDGFLKTPRGAR